MNGVHPLGPTRKRLQIPWLVRHIHFALTQRFMQLSRSGQLMTFVASTPRLNICYARLSNNRGELLDRADTVDC